ncbi:MAG: FHA domain-containing protein [Candidatus Acidiferrales bacterium]
MAVLVVKFEGSVLQNVPVLKGPITIGRAPDNSIAIDNASISTHHARVEIQQGRLILSDLGSLNGTFVNTQRVKSATLKDGDVISIGKHSIYVDEMDRTELARVGVTQPVKELVAVPAMAETFVLDTRQRRQMIQELAAAGERSQLAPTRVRVATLSRVEGKLDQEEYPLTSKLTVIGKSTMATIRLRGWFKPKVAAQISRGEDGYYLGLGDQIPSINGKPIDGPTLLSHGDLIEVCGVKLRFVIHE